MNRPGRMGLCVPLVLRAMHVKMVSRALGTGLKLQDCLARRVVLSHRTSRTEKRAFWAPPATVAYQGRTAPGTVHTSEEVVEMNLHI